MDTCGVYVQNGIILSVQEKKMNAMDEKVMFRIPGDELAAFKRRIAADGLTISVFLRMRIKDYLETPPVAGRTRPMDIPFAGCLKGEAGDYRSRAAEYFLGRRA